MSAWCDLPQEMYWDNAQQLLVLALGDPTLPDEPYAGCFDCGRIGWAWKRAHGNECLGCRALRLRREAVARAQALAT